MIFAGDSGGPLILANHRMGDINEGSPALDLLVGITSFGPAPCTQTDLPSISTDAAFFRDWIMKTIVRRHLAHKLTSNRSRDSLVLA